MFATPAGVPKPTYPSVDSGLVLNQTYFFIIFDILALVGLLVALAFLNVGYRV